MSLLLLTWMFLAGLMQHDDWRFEYEKEGISVYTLQVENSNFKAFRGEMKTDIPMEQLAALISDIERYSDWCYRTTATNVLKKEEGRIYYYYESATPPGIKNREAYLYTDISKDSITGHVLFEIHHFESDEKIPSGYIRMPFSSGFWMLIPLEENSTRVIFQMHSDPGGMIPAWLANSASVDAPWITMNNMRKLLSK
jgi:ribosome-associated toxin RatA of RatAB toxin-antitoxin module